MPLVRVLVSWKRTDEEVRDALSNTLYFNVSEAVPGDTNYQSLVNDIRVLYSQQDWTGGRNLDVRAYNMEDTEPRPIKARATGTGSGGSATDRVPQVALCLSYYADRNLPRQRGRIYTGPWTSSASSNGRPTSTQMNALLSFGSGLAGIGGVNVDWSLYSPTLDSHTRLSRIWVDDSFDIIRSRKLRPKTRVGADING